MEDKVQYLLNILGHDIKNLEFEDVNPPNIFQQLSDMLSTLPIIEDSYFSETTEAQSQTENSITSIYKKIIESHKHINAHFELENHIDYTTNCLTEPLPAPFVGYDCNHTWMLYWLSNAGHILHHEFPEDVKKLVAAKIESLVVDGGKGGIAGGKNQLGHVASTYAGILALVSLREYKILGNIRQNLHSWFLLLKQSDGSFLMHYNGESDNRSTYCVLVVCSLLNMLDDEICEKTLDWVTKTQTYEGGFAGVSNTEAHGGYTYCAVSSLFLLLGKQSKNILEFKHQLEQTINFSLLLRWLVARQLNTEGGLNGRSNKLVDACYSFWIGGCYALMELVLNAEMFNKEALKIYILNCSQETRGGFKDKPGKRVDFYHTNYTLLGLSIAEHKFRLTEQQNVDNSFDFFAYNGSQEEVDDDVNTTTVSPVFGIPQQLADGCKKHFSSH